MRKGKMYRGPKWRKGRGMGGRERKSGDRNGEIYGSEWRKKEWRREREVGS